MKMWIVEFLHPELRKPSIENKELAGDKEVQGQQDDNKEDKGEEQHINRRKE